MADDAEDAIAGPGDDEQSTDSDVIRNPEQKHASEEAARYRIAAKAERQRADEAEQRATKAERSLRTLALRSRFNDAAYEANVTDVDAAWKLAESELASITIDDDGEVDARELAAVIREVARRHPAVVGANLMPSGRPPNRRRLDEDLDTEALGQKFPALRRR